MIPNLFNRPCVHENHHPRLRINFLNSIVLILLFINDAYRPSVNIQWPDKRWRLCCDHAYRYFTLFRSRLLPRYVTITRWLFARTITDAAYSSSSRMYPPIQYSN